jgi:hypothetical protein
MTHPYLLDLFANSLRDIERFSDGLPDDRLAEQPGGFRNHPAWTLTHLCVASDFAMQVLFDRATTCPADWGPKASPGSRPVVDRAAYPPLATLLETLRRLHADFDAAMRAAPADLFERDAPDFVKKFSPKLGHLGTYMLATHENYHLAQLLQWKRAAGLAKD